MDSLNTTTFYNPKSRSPAVYIECWLIQVSTKLLSNNAKILYGRISQWSDGKGNVFRSLPQLSQELGTPVRTLEKHLKELTDAGLIATFHPQAGGVNHYRFLYHPWMDEPINDNLVYKFDPPPNMGVPSPKYGGTPPPNMGDINIKEIKEIKESNNNIITQAREGLEVLENPTGKIKPNPYVESTYDTAFKTERDKLDSEEFSGSALPPLLHVEDPPGFNAFFEIYPVKSSKRLARALWWEYKLESKALEIIEKVKQQKQLHVRWKNKEFIPSPVNYLKNEGWEDEIIEASTTQNSSRNGKFDIRRDYDHNDMEWASQTLFGDFK